MKKPTLRMRQVFEGPTHFKVVKPLGNPIKIAKKGLSPNLMSRLRKYSNGTPDEPVRPPTDEEISIAEQMQQARLPAGTEFPPMAGEGSFGVPPLPAEPDADVLPVPEPIAAPVAPIVQPVVVAPVTTPARVVATPAQVAAAPAATPVVTTTAAPVAPVAAPVAVEPTAPAKPPAPTLEERRAELVKQYMADFEAQEAKRIEDQNRLMDRFAQINQEAKDVAQSRLVEAKQTYARQQAALTEFERDRPMTGGDVARAIGSAISVAAGAFAAGMTGMPNFAMKIYEDGLARDLQRQREQRNSLVKQMELSGLSVEEAEKLYRAQKDKEFAARMEVAASTMRNPKARDEALKAATTLASKALLDEADIATKQAKAYEATEKGKLATEQAKAVQPELELKAAEQLRKLEKDRQDAIQAVLDRASREKIEAAKVRADIESINKRYIADMAGIAAKGEEGVLPDMGAPIPDFLRGAKPEEIRKHRVEYEMPVRKPDGSMDVQRAVGFLQDPANRTEFQKRMFGLKVVEKQAKELRDWAQEHPGGLPQILLTKGPAEVLRQKEIIEPLVKTTIEGYIANLTGVRRASTAAINLMKSVVRDPTQMGDFLRGLGTKGARFESILDDIERGKDVLRDEYLVGGAPRPQEAQPRRGLQTFTP